MRQFPDRLVNVLKRAMRGGFLDLLDLRIPAPRQFLQRADVQVPVVKELLQVRHPARQEAPVLADAVAAHRRGPVRDMLRQELDRLLFGLRLIAVGTAHFVGQPGSAVVGGVPFVHPGQARLRLVDRPHRAGPQHVEV